MRDTNPALPQYEARLRAELLRAQDPLDTLNHASTLSMIRAHEDLIARLIRKVHDFGGDPDRILLEVRAR